MEYTHLGRTGLQVSRLCLGTMNFGPQTTEPDSFAMMDAALEAGVNFIDTANVYGRSKGRGATETILGHWFEKGGGRREKVVLATKVYGRMTDNDVNAARLSARNIRHACEASLQRLKTDHIDLYQMHHIDRHTPWEEVWQAMDRLIQEGKVLYVGSSNFAAWHIVQANEVARRRNMLGIVSEQSLYHLNARSIELEVLPACQAYGVGVMPWSPLGSGLLAGAMQKATEGRRSSDFVRTRIEQSRQQVGAYEAFCKELGHAPAEVALAWLLANKAVTAPVIGPRTIDQLTSALRAVELKLDETAMAKLDKIWPGPGGQAPEAYAW